MVDGVTGVAGVTAAIEKNTEGEDVTTQLQPMEAETVRDLQGTRDLVIVYYVELR